MKKLLTDRGIAALIVLIAAILAWVPMQLSGMIDNGDWHIHWFRLQGFSQSLLEGVWRPYWHADANSGYGAPTFLFYPPLSYYLASVPVLLGLATPAAWALAYLAIILVAAFGSYRLFRLWSSAKVAACVSALYVLSPPVLFKVYQMHMPASALAIALIPWLLSAMLSPNHGAGKRVSTIAATSALLILAHPMIAVQAAVVMAMLISYPVVRGNVNTVLQAVAGGALGLLVSAWYWLPLLLFRDLVQWEFLLNPAWLWENNVLFSRPDPPYGAFHDYRSLFDGLAIAGLATGIACYAVIWTCYEGSKALATMLLVSILACLFIMSPAGIWLAQAIPPVGYLMFAWRWLGVQWLLVFGLLALAFQVFREGFDLHFVGKKRLVFVVPSILLAGMLVMSLAVVGVGPVSDSWGLKSEPISELRATKASRDEIWSTLEMRPKSMGKNWNLDLKHDPMPMVWVRSGDFRVHSIGRNPHQISIDYKASRTSTVRLKHLNFPSWTARVGEEAIPIETERGSGAMVLTVPPGTNSIVLKCEGWPWISNESN